MNARNGQSNWRVKWRSRVCLCILSHLAMAKQATGGGGTSRKKSDDVEQLIQDAQGKYKFLGNMLNNIGTFSGKYSEEAIKEAQSYLENEYVKANTNYGYK